MFCVWLKCHDKEIKTMCNVWVYEQNFLASYPFPHLRQNQTLMNVRYTRLPPVCLLLSYVAHTLAPYWMIAPSTVWTHSPCQFEQTHRHSNTTKCWHMAKTMTTNIAKGQNNFSISHYKLTSILAYLMMLSLLHKSYSVECWDDSEWPIKDV